MKEYTIYKTSSGIIVSGGITNSELSKLILESDLCDAETKEKFKKELSKIYISRFDLINDHKIKLNNINKLLQQHQWRSF